MKIDESTSWPLWVERSWWTIPCSPRVGPVKDWQGEWWTFSEQIWKNNKPHWVTVGSCWFGLMIWNEVEKCWEVFDWDIDKISWNTHHSCHLISHEFVFILPNITPKIYRTITSVVSLQLLPADLWRCPPQPQREDDAPMGGIGGRHLEETIQQLEVV